MSTRTHRISRPAHASGDLLASLATEIDDVFRDLTADEPAQLLRIVTGLADPTQIELGLLPLESGDHPAQVMAGFTAPAEWSAIGVVTTGRNYALDQGEPAGPMGPVRATFLLDRAGATATLLSPIGSSGAARRSLREPPDGLLADACRRVLGLATAPPTEGIEAWLTSRWLDRLLTKAVAEPGAVASWDEAVGLHPLVPAGLAPSPRALAELVDHTAAEFDWERLRLLAVQNSGVVPAVAADVAAWMDAGCFARHMLAAELPTELVMTELEALLPAAVVIAVRAALPTGSGVTIGRMRTSQVNRGFGQPQPP